MSVRLTSMPQRRKNPGRTKVASQRIMLIANKFFTTGGMLSKNEDLLYMMPIF